MEEIKEKIVYLAVKMSQSKNELDREYYKNFLDYYIDVAIKNYSLYGREFEESEK
jgi:hypothetical protein